jgi:D-methionine transport system substrate-binding protein
MNSSRRLHLKVRRFVTGLLLAASLTGCGPSDLRVGTISGPETELMHLVKTVALQDYGLRIKIVEFKDYRLLNTALNDGGLDVNIFQHQPYLTEELKSTKYRLISIGKTFIYPMGIYSYKFTHLGDIKKRSIVAIPHDPTNKARALRLLEKAGLIKLDIDAGFLVTPKAIRYNPKELQFKMLDAAQLTQVLQKDIDIAVINANYAILAELYANQHALFVEDKRALYANLIVVRESDRDREPLKQLVAAYQDEEVLAHAKAIFKDQAIPAYHGGEGGIRTRGRL